MSLNGIFLPSSGPRSTGWTGLVPTYVGDWPGVEPPRSDRVAAEVEAASARTDALVVGEGSMRCSDVPAEFMDACTASLELCSAPLSGSRPFTRSVASLIDEVAAASVEHCAAAVGSEPEPLARRQAAIGISLHVSVAYNRRKPCHARVMIPA